MRVTSNFIMRYGLIHTYIHTGVYARTNEWTHAYIHTGVYARTNEWTHALTHINDNLKAYVR